MTIWVDRGGLASTSTGTGTDPTTAVTLKIPGTARELVSIRVNVHSTAPAPAESVTGVCSLTGKDWNNGDYEFFSEIGGSHLGAINGNPYAIAPRWWPCHQPVVPNGEIGLVWEGLDALAGNGSFKVSCKWSNQPTGLPRTNRKATRETPTSTSAGPALTLSGALKITEFTTAVSTSTVAADDPSSGSISITASNLMGQQTNELDYNIMGIEATSGIAWTTLNHADLDIDVNPGETNSVQFTSVLSEDVSLSTAGQWAYSVGYWPL